MVNPLELINHILRGKQKTEKKSFPKEKCIRWLNILLTFANAKQFSNLEERIHYNRDILEQKYPGKCPQNDSSYFLQLERWNRSGSSHDKVKAVYTYVSKKTLIKDLIDMQLLAIKDGKLAVVEKTDEKEKVKVTAPNENDSPVIINSKELHPIMKLLAFQRLSDGREEKNQAKVFIRWKVESDGSLCSETWKDKMLFDKWAEYTDSLDAVKGFCCVTGDKETVIAQKLPWRVS